MIYPRLRVSHILPLALACATVTFILTGCGRPEGISSTTVPKSTEKNEQAVSEYRMLGAMFPADEPVWFFKFSGPADELTKYEAGFDELLKSVKLNGAASVDFTAPKGWTKGPGRDGFVKVVATATPPDSKLEVTVTASGGGVPKNLGRWVEQIGLMAGPDDLAKYTKTIETASGVKGLRVDLKGPKNPVTNRGSMMPAGHP